MYYTWQETAALSKASAVFLNIICMYTFTESNDVHGWSNTNL